MPPKKEKQPLSVTHPELAKEADGWDPSLVTYGSNQKLFWKCSEGHRYEAVVGKRTSRNDGCTYCSGRKILEGFNDLKTTHQHIAIQAFGWDPTKFTAGSNEAKLWKCPEEHTYIALIVKRTNRSHGCPYCSGHKVWLGFNDLATTHPKISAEAVDGPVTNYSAGSQQKLTWKCQFGHIYNAKIAKRVLGTNCSYCAKSGKKKILSGFNDLLTTHPVLAHQAFGWDPSKRSMGQSVKLKWKCEKDHIWSAKITKRVSGQGCPSCSVSGFDPNKKGFLYLMTHELWQLHKVGISNLETDRTNKHKQSGWELIDIRGPMDGLLAYDWEQSILSMLKSRGVEIGSADIAGKFDGYSETWASNIFPVSTIKELMNFVRENE